MPKIRPATIFMLGAFTLALAACTPKYDWREVHNSNPPFDAVFPAKPSSFTRAITLEGQQVMMTMVAAEVDGVTFAVGTATFPDADNARHVLGGMKAGLVNNIAGTVQLEKAGDDSATRTASIYIEATGRAGPNGGAQPLQLFARFVAKDKQVYQAVVMGRDKEMTRDAVDTFFTSFKPN